MAALPAEIAARIQPILRARFDAEIDQADIAEFLRPILFEQRALIAAAELGIVTDREVAGATCARMTDWVARREGCALRVFAPVDADRLIDEVEAAIFG